MPGTGADLTLQESLDLLHKLMTESTKVLAAYSDAGGSIWAAMQGMVKVAPDGRFGVMRGAGFDASSILFDPTKAVVRKWGDVRVLQSPPQHLMDAGAPNLDSALIFGFSDGASIALFELNH